ncbi:MAG: nucleotidyltransferase substrate binding protein [Gammaproteobacteria bacterium]|nr:nucleotidyltransferase substrate binding protein [Gammaproteobacteria bacterium]
MTPPAASERLRLALTEWSRALTRLEEALALPPGNELLVDGTIQRFEFCFELCWKALKFALLEAEGFEVASPRQALQKAYAVQWLAEEAPWVAMLSDRNLSSHTYRETLAGEIFGRIPAHARAMGELCTRLCATFGLDR